jgi:hypothetical protein
VVEREREDAAALVKLHRFHLVQSRALDAGTVRRELNLTALRAAHALERERLPPVAPVLHGRRPRVARVRWQEASEAQVRLIARQRLLRRDQIGDRGAALVCGDLIGRRQDESVGAVPLPDDHDDVACLGVVERRA